VNGSRVRTTYYKGVGTTTSPTSCTYLPAATRDRLPLSYPTISEAAADDPHIATLRRARGLAPAPHRTPLTLEVGRPTLRPAYPTTRRGPRGIALPPPRTKGLSRLPYSATRPTLHRLPYDPFPRPRQPPQPPQGKPSHAATLHQLPCTAYPAPATRHPAYPIPGPRYRPPRAQPHRGPRLPYNDRPPATKAPASRPARQRKTESADLPYTRPREGSCAPRRTLSSARGAPASHVFPRLEPAPRRAVVSGKSRRRRAYPQQIVTTRLLYCLQDPFAQLSRLQRI
jgi:hypothetical protein